MVYNRCSKVSRAAKGKRMSPARREPDVRTYSGRVAKRLRQLRDRSGYSVQQVVERMERFGYALSIQGYYKWENGRAKVDLDAVPALAKALRLKTVKELFPSS